MGKYGCRGIPCKYCWARDECLKLTEKKEGE